MTEYYINAWEELTELNHMSMAQLHETITSLGIHVCNNTFITWRQNGTIPVEHLASICNNFRFPISHFTRVAGLELDKREYRLYSEEEWQPIRIDILRLINFNLKVEHRLREDAISHIGCSPTYYDAFRKYPTEPLPPKFTFVALLTYINNCNMYPGDIIIDENVPFQLEFNVRPYYNNKALQRHYDQFPQPTTTLAADDIIDTKDFLLQYVTKGHLEGDDKVVGISVQTLNEISSIITNLRDENSNLHECIKELRTEISNIKESLKPFNH